MEEEEENNNKKNEVEEIKFLSYFLHAIAAKLADADHFVVPSLFVAVVVRHSCCLFCFVECLLQFRLKSIAVLFDVRCSSIRRPS
jgi:hypothetical protein